MSQMLGKGQNLALPPGQVAVHVQAGASVDVSALLLTATGKVRGDDDFVFYNQPSAGGVRYRADGVDVDPGQVPSEIERVVVAVSLDGNGPATFGQLGPLTLTVSVGRVAGRHLRPRRPHHRDGAAVRRGLPASGSVEGARGRPGLRRRARRDRHQLRDLGGRAGATAATRRPRRHRRPHRRLRRPHRSPAAPRAPPPR